MGQIIAEASLEAPESYIEGVQKEYVERRNCLVNGLNQIPGVFSPMPKGASTRSPSCPWTMPRSSALAPGGVLLRGRDRHVWPPQAASTAPRVPASTRWRLAYVLCCDELRKALVCLEKALEAYPGRVK